MAAITIGTRRFATKRDATLEVRRILNAAEIDVVLEGGDGTLIAALYDLHPRKELDVVKFCVGTNDYHGSLTRGFQAILADGSRKPWSYGNCLNPLSDNPRLTKAMRGAIMLSQRDALRNAYRGRALLPCRTCKAGLTIQDAQVHHLPPKFRDIADAFVALIGEPEVGTGRIGDEFSDLGIKKRWIMFHDAVAQRVALCRACNAADERTT